jgi:NADPH-dependent 2,4-dienoyl-CoA reductase/sulfur reductase-like enzyme
VTLRRVVIVGASAAGLAAAEALRGFGFDGSITLVGDESHAPYDRPPLTKQVLRGEWEPERTALREPGDLAALGLDERRATSAVGLDLANRSINLSTGERLGFDAVVIATGVRPRHLPGLAATGDGTVAGLHTLRTLGDALRLRSRLGPGRQLVIIGGGFLGTEAAAAARMAGAQVTLVTPAPELLSSALGELVGSVLSEVHRDHGVDLQTGMAAVGMVTEDGRATGVRLGDGSVLRADDVLVAIGSLPNTEWLAGSGLPVDDGLACDQYCAAAPGVYGAGDVARWDHPLYGDVRIEHRTNAAEQGVAAARNLLGHEVPFAPVPYFWSDQYDLKIQAYGHLSGHEEAAVIDGSPFEGRFLTAYRTGGRLSGVAAVGMPPKALLPWRAKLAVGTRGAAAVEPELKNGLTL